MGLNILVAEDNEFARLQYKKVFEKRQHRITVANDGEQCVEIYRNLLEKHHSDINPFNIVLLDFIMPKKNGVQVAKEILELRPHQKIIFLSAFGNGVLDDAADTLKNAIEIIQKPFSLEFLINKLENNYILKNIN